MEDFEFDTEERSWIATGLVNFASSALSLIAVFGLIVMFGG